MGEITPTAAEPMFPWIQDALGQYLSWWIGQEGVTGAPQYDPNLMYGGEGRLWPYMDRTVLPDVWGGWEQQDPGMQWLANAIGQNWLGVGEESPYLSSTMSYGGMGGPGNQAMSLLSQFGAPSAAGQGVANMSQFGGSSEKTVRPLTEMAYGGQSPYAGYLTPFLMNGVNYQTPNVPMNTKRRAG